MMIHRLLLLILVTLPFYGLSQNYADANHYLLDSLDLDQLEEKERLVLDSCLEVYHTSNSDTIKVNALDVLCKSITERYRPIQYNYMEDALKKELPEGVEKWLRESLAVCSNHIGIGYIFSGEPNKALEQFAVSKGMFEDLNDKAGLAETLGNIGYVYNAQGDIENALNTFKASLKLFEELGDPEGIAGLYNNIGYIYETEGDIEDALEYFLKGLEVYEQIELLEGVSACANNIGRIYRTKEDYYLALEYYYKALKVDSTLGDIRGLAILNTNIGHVHKINGDNSLALEHYLKGHQYNEAIEDKAGLVNTSVKLGELNWAEGNAIEAERFGRQGYDLAVELGYPSEIQISAQLLASVYQELGDYENAFHMYQLEIKMRDSVVNEENQKAAILQRTEYEYETKKALDDAKTEKELAVAAEKEQQQFIISLAVAGTLLIVAIFAVLIYKRLQVTKQQKVIIEEQKEKVEHQKHLVEEAHKEITDSINYAKRIQTAILPPDGYVNQHFSNGFILYKPKDVVAGDFYWMQHLSSSNENSLLFAAADCTGHGVPGAMVSVVCSGALNRTVQEFGITEPGPLLDKTRELVLKTFEESEEEVKDGMDIALCKLEGKKLYYSGANNPLWIVRNDEIIEVKADKQPIGKYSHMSPFTTHELELQENDTIYIFSDGYPDQFGGEKGKKYKSGKLKRYFKSIQDQSMQQQKLSLDEEFESWRGQIEQIDDVCVIGLRV